MGYYDDNGQPYDEVLLFKSKMLPEFKNELLRVCKELGQDPNKLVAVMRLENGHNFPNTAQWSKNRVGIGLIQFTSTAIQQMNRVYKTSYTKDLIAQMSSIEQLQLVQQYYQMYKGFNSLGDYALATFAPAFMGASGNTGVYTKFKDGTRYSNNSSLDANQDGIITAVSYTHLTLPTTPYV